MCMHVGNISYMLMICTVLNVCSDVMLRVILASAALEIPEGLLISPPYSTILFNDANVCAHLHADNEGQSLSMYSALPHEPCASGKYDTLQQVQHSEDEQRRRPRIPHLPLVGAMLVDTQPGRILLLSTC